MAKQKGRLALLAIETTTNTYTTLAGCKTKTITINNESIDVTTAPSTATTPLWMQSLPGKKSVSISADGVFLDETAEATLNTAALANDSTANFQYTVPNFGTFTGSFHITSLDFGGDTEAEVTFSIQLDSAAAITFATI